MNRKKLFGFTLIEILIYITLVAGILITATSFAWNVINSRTKAFAVQEVEQNGRFIMEKIIQSVNQANDITAPAIGLTDSQLELAMKDVLEDPTVFTLDGNTLKMSQAGGLQIELNSSNALVTRLDFTNFSTANNKTKNIKVELTIEHINPENRQEWNYVDSFNTTIELRDQ